MRPRCLLLFALVAISWNCFAQSDFSIVLLPDVQNYSEFYPQIFKSQTRWIARNSRNLNLRMVIGEGDLVNHDSSATEWGNASTAVGMLDGRVPYTLAIGNHDYDNYAPAARQATHFNSYFGPQRYASYSWYGGNYGGSNENFYTFFTAGTQQYMVLSLEYYPRSAVLDWADSLLSAYPGKKVIVVTHSFEGADGFRVDTCDNSDMSAANGNMPEIVWEKMLKWHSNVVLVVSGHLTAGATAHRTDLGVYGNTVNQIFTNFQNWPNGGNGYLRVLTFHPASNSISVSTYSPWLDASLTTADHQFSLPINATPLSLKGTVQGKVRSIGCAKLGGATVSTAGYSVVADSNGVYALAGLPAPNAYSVSVTAAGYVGSDLSATVTPGLSTQTDFYLLPAQATQASITIASPANNATVSSPFTLTASATASLGTTITSMSVYLDGKNVYGVNASSLQTTIPASSGAHKLTVQSKDSAGTITNQSVYITVN